jgi:hypothetical protein
MSVVFPIKDRRSKVHFSEYLRSRILRADEPAPAEDTKPAEKPVETTPS